MVFSRSRKNLSALFHFSLVLLPFLFLPGCLEPDGFIDDVSYYYDKARCNLRVGILSDTHLNPPHSDKVFQKALAYFSEREVDAVVIAGDVTQGGSLAARRGLRQAWDKAFPNGRRQDGNPVALILVTGEKDNETVYEELTGEKFASAFVREVKGYSFVGANWTDSTGMDTSALKPLLAKMDKAKPFFYVQNLVPYATCCPNEGRPETYDGGKVSYLLSKFPNSVAICGRSHTPLTDESAFWRGDFTCVNAGSFSYARMRGADGAPKPGVHHGLVMSAYDSAIVFERLDFGRTARPGGPQGVYVEKLGPDWKVDLPAKPASRPEAPAPQFWDDTRLMILPSANVVSVRFPPVLAKHTGVRAYAYEVRWLGGDGCPDGADENVKVVYSPGFCMSEANETRPVVCDFPREALPKGKVRFTVTPVDAFGKAGRPVSGEANL